MKYVTFFMSLDVSKFLASKLSSVLLAILTMGLSAACTSPDANPQLFVNEIYQTYISKSSGLSSLQQPDQVYSKALSTLIKNDASSTPQGEMSKLNFEPLCSCQDSSGFKDIKVGQSNPTKTGYSGQITLLTETDQKVITLNLIRESEEWRVDDVSSTDVPSLKSYLSTQ